MRIVRVIRAGTYTRAILHMLGQHARESGGLC